MVRRYLAGSVLGWQVETNMHCLVVGTKVGTSAGLCVTSTSPQVLVDEYVVKLSVLSCWVCVRVDELWWFVEVSVGNDEALA